MRGLVEASRKRAALRHGSGRARASIPRARAREFSAADVDLRSALRRLCFVPAPPGVPFLVPRGCGRARRPPVASACGASSSCCSRLLAAFEPRGLDEITNRRVIFVAGVLEHAVTLVALQWKRRLPWLD